MKHSQIERIRRHIADARASKEKVMLSPDVADELLAHTEGDDQ